MQPAVPPNSMQPDSDFFQPRSAPRQHPALNGPVFEWHAEYSVGVGVLDEHHRHIFHLLNRIYETLLLQQGRAALAYLLDELIVYTRSHFAGEELLMKCFAYPDGPSHELEHMRLVRALLEFREQFADGHENLVTPLLEFMEGRLIRHIVTTDCRYSAFFAERGAKP